MRLSHLGGFHHCRGTHDPLKHTLDGLTVNQSSGNRAITSQGPGGNGNLPASDVDDQDWQIQDKNRPGIECWQRGLFAIRTEPLYFPFRHLLPDTCVGDPAVKDVCTPCQQSGDEQRTNEFFS
jgi:hypothetical protein